MSNIEDSVMLIRSVLCAHKAPISLKELNDEYCDTTGTRVPFKQFGFDSLPAFLRTHPDKFQLRQNGPDFFISAVLDKELMDLARLVQGQKSSGKSKKKKAPVYKKPNLYSNFTFSQRTVSGNSMRKEISAEFNKNPAKVFNKYSAPMAVFRKHLDSNNNYPLKQKDANTTNSAAKKDAGNVKTLAGKANGNKENAVPDLENIIIENAAYWLKEHMIYLSHVESLNEVYIRLIGEKFSDQYEKMMSKLQDVLTRSKQPIDSLSLKEKAICTGLRSGRFYRLLVKKLQNNGQKILCFSVDEGWTELFTPKELFTIPLDFLDASLYKFQAIKVQIAYFSLMGDNTFILASIQHELAAKKYLARRVPSPAQLTISIYNSKNECIDEKFFNKNSNFLQWRAKEGEEFNAFISFIDEESSLVYLQLPGDLKVKFDDRMGAINEYYSQMPSIECIQEHAYFKKHVNDIQPNEIFCAQYALDFNWYRCRILRKISDTTLYVHFIDFGNKEKVTLSDLRVIPNKFIDFKYLPAQAFTVLTVLSAACDEAALKDCLYFSKLVTFKVLKVNAAGICSVSVLKITEQEEEETEERDKTRLLADEFKAIELDSTKADCSGNLNSSLFSKELLEEGSSEDIVSVMLKDLAETNLPAKSRVYVSYINNPTDFVINLESSRKAYEVLKSKMNAFYHALIKPNYMAKTLVKEYVYVGKNLASGECTRIKFIDYLADDYARIYDIDAGNFDAVKLNTDYLIFHITKEFLQLKPLGIKAKLSNITYESSSAQQWSITTKSFFRSIVKEKKIFVAKIIKFDWKANIFNIELNRDNCESSVNRILVEMGYAQLC